MSLDDVTNQISSVKQMTCKVSVIFWKNNSVLFKIPNLIVWLLHWVTAHCEPVNLTH
jgi:hypothetical protein